MKNLALILMCFLSLAAVSGCTTVGNFLQDKSCYESVAIGKLTVTEVVTQANLSYENNYINKADYAVVDTNTDRAMAALNEARMWCSKDEITAKDYIRVASNLILQIEPLLKPTE